MIAKRDRLFAELEPSRAEPSRAEPSRAEPSRAEPSRAANPCSGDSPARIPRNHMTPVDLRRRGTVCGSGGSRDVTVAIVASAAHYTPFPSRPHGGPMRALLTLLALAVSLPAHSGPLNDTGIDFCGAYPSGNNKPCTGTEPAWQDAHYGRDAAAGGKGFSFTALDASGADTTPTSGSTPHSCVRDNVTRLVWEVKTDDGGSRDKDWTYSWYNSNPATNGGSAGYPDYGNNCFDISRCDTEKFVVDVNAAGLCGHNDWRMPTVKELEGIVDFGRTNPAIDPTYFPNTPNWYFWTGSPLANFSNNAWVVGFYDGVSASGDDRGDGYFVRLVRGGQ